MKTKSVATSVWHHWYKKYI